MREVVKAGPVVRVSDVFSAQPYSCWVWHSLWRSALMLGCTAVGGTQGLGWDPSRGACSEPALSLF